MRLVSFHVHSTTFNDFEFLEDFKGCKRLFQTLDQETRKHLLPKVPWLYSGMSKFNIYYSLVDPICAKNNNHNNKITK